MYSIISDFGKILLSILDPQDSEFKKKLLALICEPIFIKAQASQSETPQENETGEDAGESEEESDEGNQPEETRFALTLNFDTTNNTIKFEWDEINANNRQEISEKYLWVGNTADTTNRYLTTNNMDRFLFDENKTGKSKNPIEVLIRTLGDCDLSTKLNEVIQKFYRVRTYQKGNAEVREIALNFEKLDLLGQRVEQVVPLINNYLATADKKQKREIMTQIRDLMPILKEEMFTGLTSITKQQLFGLINSRLEEGGKKEVNALVRFLLGDKLNKIQLISVKIDGQLIADNKDYVDFLYMEKFPKAEHTQNAVCDLCGQPKDSSSLDYFTKTWVKFFNQDKPIFAPYLNDNRYTDNFRVCKDCFKTVMVGESFVKKSLRLRWFDSSLMILPEIKPSDQVTQEHLKQIIEKSKEFNGNLYKLTTDYRNLERQLEDIIESIGTATLTYNYLFYASSQGGKPNKIKLLIKDVPPSRLREIAIALNEINDHRASILERAISIYDIYLTLPIRLDKKTKSIKETQFIYSLLECIFKALPINLDEYLEYCVQTMKAIMIGNTAQMNIQYEKSPYSFMKMNEILAFFEKIGCLTLPKKSEYVIQMEETVNQKSNAGTPTKMQKIQAYWDGKGVYNKEEARAMFLLGVLIAEVGSAQYKKIKNEAILKKINYDGMNINQVIKLVADVEGRLRDYKQLTYPSTMEIVQQLHSYMEKIDQKSWSLLPSANVFFIMSGYAFIKSTIFGNQQQDDEEPEVPAQ